MPFCFPLAERAELLFGDQEGHHVFPVVGFSFQPLTVHLSLGITHLAAHIVFGLNRGHGGEPTTGWPIGANSSATFVHHEYPGPHKARPRQRAAPTHFIVTFVVLCPAWAERADRRPNGAVARSTSPPQVRTIPAAMRTWRRPDSVLKSSRRHRFSLPRFLSQPNISVASPHSTPSIAAHRAHTPP